MSKITFINQSTEGTIEEEGRRLLSIRAEDFTRFFDNLDDEEVYQELNDYPLHWGPIYPLDEEDEDGEYLDPDIPLYYRLQLSTGGPGDEIRFYGKGGRIEYVFLDWYSGVGFDITGEDWARDLYWHWEDFMNS